MSYHYVVTAHQPTNVTHAVVGNFTSDDETSLVISKCTRIELHQLTEKGLQQLYVTPFYGRIATMQAWRPAHEQRDVLFITTERYEFCVLSFDTSTKELVTRASGNLQERLGAPPDGGQLLAVEPGARLITLRLYDGVLKVLPIVPVGSGSARAAGANAPTGIRDAFNVRMEELHVLDITFLHGMHRPTLAVLFQDNKEARNVRTYEVSVQDRDLKAGPWHQNNVEGGASIIEAVPQPLGGVLIIGEFTVTFHNGHSFVSIPMRPALIKAVAKVDEDGRRWLLADHNGRLSVLVLHTSVANGEVGAGAMGQRPTVTALQLQLLGETSAASAVCYLDNGFVFVGSSFGDSQVVRLLPASGDQTAGGDGGESDGGTFLEVVESMPNLGPVIDFCVVDPEKQGQGQVVCCSGAFKDGSLRVMRNGIGIHEHASVDLEGIKNLWALRPSEEAEYDSALVVSFIDQTRVLTINGDELAEASVPAFEERAKTLAAATLRHGTHLQVCTHRVALASAATGQLRGSWTPPEGRAVSVAVAGGEDVLLALSSPAELVHLRVREGGLEQHATLPMAHEVACLALSDASAGAPSRVAAVGLWSRMEVMLVQVPSLRVVGAAALPGEIMPRSILFASMDHGDYLLCGMGDGRVVSFACNRPGADATMEPGDVGAGPRLSERKVVALGTQPVHLVPFRCQGRTHVFAASDRPTVISSSAHKLLYSNVNLKEATHMSPFNCEAFPESLAVAGETTLTVGDIDSIQKLHIKKVHLGEHLRRIAHDEEARCFAVTTSSSDDRLGAEEGDGPTPMDATGGTEHVRIIDDSTFEVMDSFALLPTESANAIDAMTLVSPSTGNSVRAFVVGTAFIVASEKEPLSGRLLALAVSEGRVRLLAEAQTDGSVYSCAALRGRVVAGVNQCVTVFAWEDSDMASAAGGVSSGRGTLLAECVHPGHIVALCVETRGDFIVVGDLMKSISVHVYKAHGETPCIEEIARDFNGNWMTAVAILDDDTFLGAEHCNNLFVVRKNADEATDDERGRLEVAAEFHLGDFVNRFRAGSLSVQVSDGDTLPMPTLLFGTVNGAIGVIARISEEAHAFLSKLEACLSKVIQGVGGLGHASWRAFHSDDKVADAFNFIDGDLVETFLDLSRSKQEEVAAAVGIDVEDLCKRIEELTRIH